MRARQHDRGRTLSNREDTGGGCVDPRTKEVGAPPSVSSSLPKQKKQKKNKNESGGEEVSLAAVFAAARAHWYFSAALTIVPTAFVDALTRFSTPDAAWC